MASHREQRGREKFLQINRHLNPWGTRQGCLISPYIFNLFTELIFRTLKSDDKEVSVGGKRVSNLSYADNTAITAENENEQHILTEIVLQEGKGSV